MTEDMPCQYSPLFARFGPAALALSWPVAAGAALIAVSTGAYFSAAALAFVPVTAAVVLWFSAGFALWRSGGRLLEAPAPVFLARAWLIAHTAAYLLAELFNVAAGDALLTVTRDFIPGTVGIAAIGGIYLFGAVFFAPLAHGLVFSGLVALKRPHGRAGRLATLVLLTLWLSFGSLTMLFMTA